MNGKRRASARGLLPSPAVRFAPDFPERLGALAARLHAGAQRREGAGRASLFGVGQEFVGYRPYSRGEDLRNLDWTLLARHEKPFVRVNRREASEDWAVLLDTSASMGVGRPGKLQRAAEVAAGIAACGLRAGASVSVVTSSSPVPLVVRRKGGAGGALGAVLELLEAQRAEGERGLGALLESVALGRAGRVFALGDLFDVAPPMLARLARPGRECVVVRVLAVDELVPERTPAVEWVDAETGEELRTRVGAAQEAAYEDLVSAELERWRELAARHRVRYGVWTSEAPLEDIARDVLQ